MTSTAPRYEFDEAFQAKIAAMVLRDDVFNKRTEGLIKPEYFENDADASLVSLGLDFYRAYKQTPSTVVLAKLFKDAVAKKIIRGDLETLCRERLVTLLKKTDISDRDYVIDQVVEFAQHQAMSNAILESVELVEKRRFAEVEKKIKDAMSVGQSQDDSGSDYFDTIEERTARRKALLAGTILRRGITTGFRDFDQELYHHGWGRGELQILMGGAKVGKTMGLINFGINAALAGYTVLYCSLEVSKTIIEDRMDTNIANLPFKEIGLKPHEVEEKVKEVRKRAGTIKIHEFPTGTMRPSDLRRLIRYYAGKGVKFDLVIVDYADIMAPERYSREPIENSKSIFVDLRAIAQEEDVAMLSATQTNREGFKSAVAKAEHVAEDFNKIRIADLVISINASDEERAMGEARLYFAASRNQAQGFTLRIKQDLERMQFLKKVLRKE